MRIRPPGWWVRNGIAAVAAVAGLFGYAWRYVIVFGIIWGVYAFCARYSRQHSGETSTAGFWQKFWAAIAKSAGIYLLAAEIAIGIFLFLALIVTRVRGVLSIGQLRSLHSLLTGYSSFWDQWIKLEDVWLLVAYIAVWVLTSFLLLQKEELSQGRHSRKSGPPWRHVFAKRMRQVVDFHGRYSGPVSVMLAILASFTFFSASFVPLSDQLHSQLVLRLSQRADQLRMQEAQNASDYKKAARQVAADLNAQVISGLSVRIQKSMPPTYRKMLPEAQFQAQVDKINAEAQQLGKSLRTIDPDAARDVDAENVRRQRLQDLPARLAEPSPDGSVQFSVPRDLTTSQAAAVRKWVKSDTGGDTVDLLNESGSAVMMQAGTTFVSARFWDNFKAVVKGHIPFAEPMVDILSSTVGDQLQEAVYERVAPIVRQIMVHPAEARARIYAAAQAIVSKVNISSLVSEYAPVATNLAVEREAELSSLMADVNSVAYQVKLVQQHEELMRKIAQEQNDLVRKAVIDPVDIEANPFGSGFISPDDFGPALNGMLSSSESVQAGVVKRLVEISQYSDSELQALWKSYNLQIESGDLLTNQVEGMSPIVMPPNTLKHNAAHVIKYLASDLPGVISSEDLAIANDNCGCSGLAQCEIWGVWSWSAGVRVVGGLYRDRGVSRSVL